MGWENIKLKNTNGSSWRLAKKYRILQIKIMYHDKSFSARVMVHYLKLIFADYYMKSHILILFDKF